MKKSIRLQDIAESLNLSEEKVQKEHESYVSLRTFVDKEDIANMAIFLLS